MSSKTAVSSATVQGGQVTVSGLPFPDGEKVQVQITQMASEKRTTIDQVRQALAGAVERYDDPFEPVLSADSWDMLK